MAVRTLALVNNMSEGAYRSTERQIVDLVEAAVGVDDLEVATYSLPGIARSPEAEARIAAETRPLDHLRTTPPDLLVVTGSEPVAEAVEDEPVWEALSGLLDWCAGRVPAVLLSCLAAHAALTRFDGLSRRRLPVKCTGVFPQVVAADDPLTVGVEPQVPVPHSRWNTVDTADVERAGWRVALGSEATGWTVASKPVAGTTVVLVQGHPEYGPTSLLREYHRDVRRYLTGEQDALPCLPVGCVHPVDEPAIDALQAELAGGNRELSLLDAFPFDEAADRATWPWREAAVRLYRNWVLACPGERSD